MLDTAKQSGTLSLPMKNTAKYEAGQMVALRLSEADAELMNGLDSHYGLNMTELLRLGIRRLAQQSGINLQKQAPPRKKSA